MRYSRIVVFCWLALAPQLSAEGSRPYKGPIIDVHLHTLPLTSSVPQEFTPGGVRPVAGNGADLLRATLAEMRRYNVVRGYVMPGTLTANFGAERAWAAQSGGLLIPGLNIVGTDENGSPPVWGDPMSLRKAVRDYRYGLLGELVLQYLGIRATDPRLAPYWALAEELDIPIGIHMGMSFPGIAYDPAARGFRSWLGNPQTLEDVLADHPKLRVYLMHAGLPFLSETIAVMHLYPQVYVDLAAIDWLWPSEHFNDYLQTLMKAGLGERIMFGSDQMIWPEGIGLAIARINDAPFLTWEQKRDIFYANAVRFFRESPEPGPSPSR